MKPSYSLHIPEYSIQLQPDYKKIGVLIDDEVKKRFFGRHVAIRYLSLQDHTGLELDNLIQIIDETGSDRYDPERKMSVAHDFYTEKGVELFAVPAIVDAHLDISSDSIKDFFEGAKIDRGYSLKIDLLVIYDADKLDNIPIKYDDGIGKESFKFKDPNNKQDAVLGFIKILSH